MSIGIFSTSSELNLCKGSQLGIYLDWVRTDGGEMPADKDIRDGVLYIRNVQEDAAGVYSCIGLSASGSMLFSASTRLEVVGNYLIVKHYFLPFIYFFDGISVLKHASL